MSDILPEDACHELLLRVPAESLLRFRSACKSWCRIIDGIDFVRKHHNLHHQEDGDHLIIRLDSGKLYLLPLSSIIDCSNNQTTLKNVKNLSGIGVPNIQDFPVPSYGGLSLIIQYGERTTIWNPFIRESLDLPLHCHAMGSDWYCSCCGLLYYSCLRIRCYSCCGIGYDSATGDFKVVKIIQFWDREIRYVVLRRTLIYSLKSNCWKSIPGFRKPVLCDGRNGVFVNGALHWIISQGTAAECILALDLRTENERVFPGPLLSPEDFHSFSFTLHVLGGCLCLQDSRAIWIMKDYGENVWTELVSSEQLPDMGRPIAYIKRKGQVIFHCKKKESELLLFDVEKKCAKKVPVRWFYDEYFTSQVIPSSLFRLNRSEGGDGSIAIKRTLKRKRKNTNNR